MPETDVIRHVVRRVHFFSAMGSILPPRGRGDVKGLVVLDIDADDRDQDQEDDVRG